MLAAKLPLLCAQADDPNKASVTMTRPGSANLVIIELFFIIICSPVASVPQRKERLVNNGSPETSTASCPIKDPPSFDSCLLALPALPSRRNYSGCDFLRDVRE
jgi:hypothetical protein